MAKESDEGGPSNTEAGKDDQDRTSSGEDLDFLSDFEDMMGELRAMESVLGKRSKAADTTVNLIGSVPGFAMAQGYLATANAQAVLAQNAVEEQRLGALLGLTTTSKCVKGLLAASDQSAIERLEDEVARLADEVEKRSEARPEPMERF